MVNGGAQGIYFPPEFAPEDALFGAKLRIFAKNGTL
jgi:hypothetical protein